MYPNRSSKLLREIKDKLQLWQVFVYPFNFTSAAYFHFGYMIFRSWLYKLSQIKNTQIIVFLLKYDCLNKSQKIASHIPNFSDSFNIRTTKSIMLSNFYSVILFLITSVWSSFLFPTFSDSQIIFIKKIPAKAD